MPKTLLLVALLPLAAHAGSLDRALIARAGQALEEVAGAGHKTLGVLPFRVTVGGKAVAAPLAKEMPGRLENALIVVQGSVERLAVRLLREATEPANWATDKAAFDRLFASESDLAWGGEKAKPDALLTGEVSCAADRRSAYVTLELLDPAAWKDGKPAPRRLVRFKVEADVPLLRDLGLGFSLPRSALKPSAKPGDADALAAAQKERVTTENVGGMRLEVEYDGVKQEADADGRLPAAKPGQKVALRLTRVADDDARLGAVLRVNGKSLFEEQEGDGGGCRKWVFDPSRKGKPQDFAGVYARESTKVPSKPFDGLTGRIDLDVFGGPATEDAGVSTRALTATKARTLKELQARLARANNLTLKKSVVAARAGGLLILDIEAAGTISESRQPLTLPLGGVTLWVGKKD